GVETQAWEEDVIAAVVEIAEQGGWSPAQVALAWLRGRPGNVVPIVAATKEAQLADNLASTGVRLDADAVARLDEVSAVPLGFPRAFRRARRATGRVSGARGHETGARRSTHRRTVHDVL